jgi:hypothetical protein
MAWRGIFNFWKAFVSLPSVTLRAFARAATQKVAIKCKSGGLKHLARLELTRIHRKSGLLQLQNEVPAQVTGFSPVITFLHNFSPFFHPIFQLQLSDFSPVANFTTRRRRFLCASCLIPPKARHN